MFLKPQATDVYSIVIRFRFVRWDNIKDADLLLTYLKAVLAGGSLTKGAENLFVSQPYLSKYINNAEQELGFRLLNRKKRPISLTPQGAKFIQGIETLNISYQKLINEVTELSNPPQSRIRLGINQSMASIILPPLIYRFKRKYPHQKIWITEDRSINLEELLLQKKIDMHIRMLPIFPSEISFKMLSEIPIYLVINKSCPLFEKGKTTIETLNIQNIHLISSEFITIESGSGFMRLIEVFMSQNDLNIHPTFETKYIETAANLAYQGLGCTFIPQFFVTNKFNASLCNVIRIPMEQISLKIVLSYLEGAVSEQTLNSILKLTNVTDLVSSMNNYQYREILK
ncbi:LysR family transcriptional regulator [Pediococcus acidilactici]|nr:LysR family transcriptional regulator [Pediococcus acidilactici]UWF33879.1 LysR family transcriptional regulator [Pediococcus acidilactici]